MMKNGICVFGASISKYHYLRHMIDFTYCIQHAIEPNEKCECRQEAYYNYTSKKCIKCLDIDKNMIVVNNACVCNPSKYMQCYIDIYDY